MQNDTIQKIEKRTQRYWYEDGIWEIGFGLVNAVLGGFYLLDARLEEGLPSIVLVLLQMAVIFSSYLIVGKLVAFLKERITYPRTGYVAYRKPARQARLKRVLLSILIAIGVAGLVGLVAAVQLAPNRMPLIISIVLVAAILFIGWRFALLRLFIVGPLTILLAYLITFFPLSEEGSTGVFFCGFGLLMLFSGLITLLLYMRRTRPAGSPDADLPDEN